MHDNITWSKRLTLLFYTLHQVICFPIQRPAIFELVLDLALNNPFVKQIIPESGALISKPSVYVVLQPTTFTCTRHILTSHQTQSSVDGQHQRRKRHTINLPSGLALVSCCH